MMNSTMRFVSAAFAMLAISQPAVAENIAYASTPNGPFWFGTLTQHLPLTAGGATTVRFNNPKAGLVSITFSADCQVIAATTAVMNIDIFIDNQIVDITNGDDALCAGRGVNVEGGWARHTFPVAKSLVAGVHAVRVDAAVRAVHNGARLDNITILVQR